MLRWIIIIKSTILKTIVVKYLELLEKLAEGIIVQHTCYIDGSFV